MGPVMKISQASEQTGLSAHTLRYYEKLGFVEPRKDSIGYRDYSSHDVDLLNWIACLKKSGMTLESIKHYVHVARSANHTEQAALLDVHLEKLYQQQKDIEHYIQVTKDKIRTLHA